MTANLVVALDGSGKLPAVDGSQLMNVPNTSPWTLSGTLVTYTGGNVGIGTTSPNQKLEIVGSSTTGVASQTNISAFASNGLRITGAGTSSQDAITYQSGNGGGGAGSSLAGVGTGILFLSLYTNSPGNSGTGSIQERVESRLKW